MRPEERSRDSPSAASRAKRSVSRRLRPRDRDDDQRHRADEIDAAPAPRSLQEKGHRDRADDRAKASARLDDTDHHAAAVGRVLLRRVDHRHRVLAEQEDARDQLAQREHPDVGRERRQQREQRVAHDGDRQHPLASPAVGPVDDEVREHVADRRERHEEPGVDRVEPHLGAHVGQDLREREQVVALEEGRDAQEEEQPALVRRERRGAPRRGSVPAGGRDRQRARHERPLID
jgi:hypothetical protein